MAQAGRDVGFAIALDVAVGAETAVGLFPFCFWGDGAGPRRGAVAGVEVEASAGSLVAIFADDAFVRGAAAPMAFGGIVGGTGPDVLLRGTGGTGFKRHRSQALATPW